MSEFSKIRPPEFEIRANQFIHHVNGVKIRMWSQRKGEILGLLVEKALIKHSNGLSELSRILDDEPKIFSESQRLDRLTPDYCLVYVSAQAEYRNAIQYFVTQVN